MKLVFTALVSLAQLATLGAIAPAQSSPPSAKSPNTSAVTHTAKKDSATASGAEQTLPTNYPVINLQFDDEEPIPNVPQSPVVAGPVLCSPSGVPFLDIPKPPDYYARVIYSFDPKGGHAFATDAITGLYGVNFKGYYVTGSSVGLLVSATTDSKKSAYTFKLMPNAPPRSVYTGVHDSFIAEFDMQGNFKKTVSLPERYRFWRVSELPDESFVALAYDPVASVPQLFLLDSDGKILRPLEIPERMAENPEATQGETGGAATSAKAETSLSWWLLSPEGKTVVLYQARSTFPVLEVGAGGEVREVPLQAPKGYVLDGMVPSSGSWIIRYRRIDLPQGGAVSTNPTDKDFVLYMVNPSDGSLMEQLDTGSMPVNEVACEEGHTLTAFSTKKGKFVLRKADIPQ